MFGSHTVALVSMLQAHSSKMFVFKTRAMKSYLGPILQRIAINRSMEINRSSMANHVELANNRNLRLIATLSETGP